MLQEAIKAEDFTSRDRPRRPSPAACGGRQLFRLALLMAFGLMLVSLSLIPGRVLSATSAIETRLGAA
jgi:hypothetical protein